MSAQAAQTWRQDTHLLCCLLLEKGQQKIDAHPVTKSGQSRTLILFGSFWMMVLKVCRNICGGSLLALSMGRLPYLWIISHFSSATSHQPLLTSHDLPCSGILTGNQGTLCLMHLLSTSGQASLRSYHPEELAKKCIVMQASQIQ